MADWGKIFVSLGATVATSLLFVLFFSSGRSAFSRNWPGDTISTASLLAKPAWSFASLRRPESSDAQLACEGLKRQLLAIDLREWSQQRSGSETLIAIEDLKGMIQHINAILDKPRCFAVKNQFREREAALGKYCSRALRLGPAGAEKGSLDPAEVLDLRKNQGVHEITAASVCLYYLLTFRAEAAREITEKTALKDIQSSALLTNAFVGELLRGKRDLALLEQLLDRAHELNPSLPISNWYRLQIAYLRMLEDPQDQARRENFTLLAGANTFEREEEIALREYLLHQAILYRDWPAFDRALVMRSDAEQSKRYFLAWRAYAEGDSEKAIRFLDRIIYRENTIFSDHIHDALTAKKRIQHRGLDQDEREIFTPPLASFGLSFLLPPDKNGDRMGAASIFITLQDERLKETPDYNDAWQEIDEKKLMAPRRLTSSTREQGNSE